LKSLFVIVNPSDHPSFDGELLWDLLNGAFESFPAPEFLCERLASPTEPALRLALSQNDWDALYLITQAEDPQGLSYKTIALLSAEGRYRYLPVRRFAQLLAEFRSLKLIVLRATRDSELSFAALADQLISCGMAAVICAPPFRPRTEQHFIEALYRGLKAGSSLNDLAAELAKSAATPGNKTLAEVHLHGKDMSVPVFAAVLPPVSSSVGSQSADELTQSAKAPSEEPTTIVLPIAPPPIAALNSNSAQLELQRKRERGEFDVFLSYNSEDRREVLKLGTALMQAGILPWVDVWELQPGQLWQSVLYEQIHRIAAAAICIGPTGIHRWQEHEINTLFIEFVERNAPVIPVFLPNAAANPMVPNFLRTLNWVDFRTNEPPPLQRLIWGITGRRAA
jgi:hypothetical protein